MGMLHVLGAITVSCIARISLAEQPSCTFVPRARQAEWDCEAMAGADLDQWNLTQAMAHAVQHSPIVNMHPAEEYVLTDPRTYWQGAHLYNRYYQRLNKTAAMAEEGARATGAHCDASTGGRLAYSFLSVLPTDPEAAREREQRERVRGSPIDAQGRSTARVFYQLIEHKGAWVYTYNLYYAWNGCGNTVFMTPAGLGQTTHTLEYISCPDSVHESDWERVSVVVCPTKQGGLPVAALLSQHNHNRLLNCTAKVDGGGPEGGMSDCSWQFGDDGQPHLAVYAGLNSHANFPAPTNSTICGQVSNQIEGAFFVDRTAEGGPIFVPTQDNVLPMPGTFPGVESDLEDWQWARYPGWWGAAEWKLPGPSITCLSANRLRPAVCPDSPAWRLVASLQGIPAGRREPPAAASEVMQPYLALPANPQAVMPFDYHSKGGAKQGPSFRPWAHHWVEPGNPPLWELPASSFLFRTLLNGGKARPTLQCFPPMVAVDDEEEPNRHHAAGPLLVPWASPWNAVLLLASIPLTLITAAAMHQALSGSPCTPTTPHGPTRSHARSSHVPGLLGNRSQPSSSHMLNRLTAALPDWLSWERRGKSGSQPSPVYSNLPYAELPLNSVEVELGNGNGSHASSNGERRGSGGYANGSHSGYEGRPSGPRSGSGNGGVGRGGGKRGVAGGGSNRWWTPGGFCRLLQGRKQCVMVLVSFIAWLMYAMGLWRAFSLMHATLSVASPLISALHGMLQAAAAALLLRDALIYCWALGVAAPPVPTKQSWTYEHADDEEQEGGTTLSDAGSRNRLNGTGNSPVPEIEEDETTVVNMASLGREETILGMGREVRTRRSGACGVVAGRALWAAGGVLSVVLVVVAVLIVLAQGVGQFGCQLLVFSRLALSAPTTAADIVGPARPGGVPPEVAHPHHQALASGTAAILVPVGAVIGAEFPSRLYAGSLCVRWRDAYGGWLLVAGSLTWAVLHYVIERVQRR